MEPILNTDSNTVVNFDSKKPSNESHKPVLSKNSHNGQLNCLVFSKKNRSSFLRHLIFGVYLPMDPV
jgi:hypothetical protein